MNIFSVLDTSDNEEEQKVVPKKGGKEAPAAKPAEKKPADKKEAPKAPRIVPGLPPKEPKGEKKTAHVPAAAPKEEAATDAAAFSKENNRGGLPRGKGRERSKAGANKEKEGEAHRRPKHEFERRSATGRGREVSRGGRGAYGAGSVEQDAQDAEKHPHEAQELLEPAAEPQTEEAGEAEAQTEPAPAVMTLDEFLEKREASRARLHEIVADKAPRKVDKAAEFGNLEPKNDTDLDAYMPAVKGKKEASKKEAQRSTAKAVLDLGFKFQQNPQPEFKPRFERSERPEREGPRGGRGGRGEGRRPEAHHGKPRSEAAPAATFSAQDFPSL